MDIAATRLKMAIYNVRNKELSQWGIRPEKRLSFRAIDALGET